MSTPPNWGAPQRGGFGGGQPPQGQGGYGAPQQPGQGYGQDYGAGPGQGGFGGPQQPGPGNPQGSFGAPGQFGAPGIAPPQPPQQAGGYGRPTSPYAQPTPTIGAPGHTFAGMHGGGPVAPAKKRPGKGLWIGLGAAALVLLLVLVPVIGEFATRGSVSGTLDTKAESIALQSGGSAVEGGFEHSVDGFSYLTQSIGGKYEHIAFTGVDLKAAGQPVEATFDAYNVPSDLTGPAERITVRTHASTDALKASFGEFLQIEDDDSGAVSVENDRIVVFYDYSTSGFEFTFSYDYTLEARDGKLFVTIMSTEMNLGGEIFSSDSPEDPVEVPVCANVADVSAEVTEASITSDGIDLAWTVTGNGATLDNLGAIGNCMQFAGA